MERFEIYVWVPTKGWKLIGQALTYDGARTWANEFSPLETKIHDRASGRNSYAGQLHVPNMNVPEAPGHPEEWMVA